MWEDAARGEMGEHSQCREEMSSQRDRDVVAGGQQETGRDWRLSEMRMERMWRRGCGGEMGGSEDWSYSRTGRKWSYSETD